MVQTQETHKSDLQIKMRNILASEIGSCGDADLLFELEGAVDDPREFADLLGLDDVAKSLCGLSKGQSLSIKGMLIELLSNHTLTLVMPNNAREEFSSLTSGELSELYGLEYVKVELVFVN